MNAIRRAWTCCAPSATGSAPCLAFGALGDRQVVYLRQEWDGDDSATYLMEIGPDGRRIWQVEVAEDGTAIKADTKDWPFNPPLVDLFDPQLPDQEVDRDDRPDAEGPLVAPKASGAGRLAQRHAPVLSLLGVGLLVPVYAMLPFFAGDTTTRRAVTGSVHLDPRQTMLMWVHRVTRRCWPGSDQRMNDPRRFHVNV